MVGLGDGAGELPVPGRPATFAHSRARVIVFIFFKTIYLPFLMSCLLGDG